MSIVQFLEWQEFSRLEPFDESRGDLRAASVVQALVNMNRDRTKHPNPFSLQRFVLRFGDDPDPDPEPQKAMDWKVMKALCHGIAVSYGA